MQDSPDYDVNYPSSIDNTVTDTSDNNQTTNTVDITEFSKILIDFLNDIILTFPEIREKLSNDLKIIYNRDKETTDDLEKSLKIIYEYCQEFYPERFFDIL